jgi:hypothetical protein
MPDIDALSDGAERLIVGCGTADSVRFAIRAARLAPDRTILSWHDPMSPADRDLEREAASACRYHFCPTRPHGDHLRSLGAEKVFVCSALLDDHELPDRVGGQGWDITHFGWVGRNSRDLSGLIAGIAKARSRNAPWRVVQYGLLPKGMPTALFRHRLAGAFSHVPAVPKSDTDRVYRAARGAAVLQMSGFFGEMCIPGKLIEAALHNLPVICDRRGALLASVCDSAGMRSWATPTDIPDVLPDFDEYCGAAFVNRLGQAIADYGIADAYRLTLA